MKDRFSLSLSSGHYSLVAIRRAMHDLSSLGNFTLASEGADFIISSCEKLSVSHDEFRKALLDAILDHEVRLHLEEEFGAIRQIIVEQAINPITSEALSKKITSLISKS